VKQVAGEDPGGLPAQEPPPGGGRAPRRQAKPVAAQRGPDRGGRGAHAKPQEFALEAVVAPARVLGGEADDQLPDVVVQRWSSVAAVRVGHAPAVPAPQGVGVTKQHDQRSRGRRRLTAASRARSGGLELGSWELASEDGELVAQDQDLQVLAASPRASSASSWMVLYSAR
jgi:hypothetical protein